MKLFQKLTNFTKKLFQSKKKYPYVKKSGTITAKESLRNKKKISAKVSFKKSGHQLRKKHFGTFSSIKHFRVNRATV